MGCHAAVFFAPDTASEFENRSIVADCPCLGCVEYKDVVEFFCCWTYSRLPIRSIVFENRAITSYSDIEIFGKGINSIEVFADRRNVTTVAWVIDATPNAFF